MKIDDDEGTVTGILSHLTAIVLSSHGSDDKKYVVTPRRVACRLKEEKRSGLKQNTLLIEGITYGPSLCLFVKELELTVCNQVGQFFIMVIKVIFARDRPIFDTNFKKSRVCAARSP